MASLRHSAANTWLNVELVGNYLALAEHLGVRARAASVTIGRVAASADVWLDSLDTLPFDVGTLHELERVIRRSQELLRLA